MLARFKEVVMIAYVKSCCSAIYTKVREYDRTEPVRDLEIGLEVKTRDYIPIGNSTLVKMTAAGWAALFLLFIPRAITGCDETQTELTCCIINGTIEYVGYAVAASMVFHACRLYRSEARKGHWQEV